MSQRVLDNTALNFVLAVIPALKCMLIPSGASVVGILTALLASKLYIVDQLYNPNPTEIISYDFIVVGAGAAGAVIASRLSANPKYTVLLLDAGGDPTFFNSLPAAALFNAHNPSTDWLYKTVPQKKSCFAYEKNVMPFVSGKALGGSTTLNYMVYQRGNVNDYESWVNATGDERWSYENVLPFFKKSENYHGHYQNASNAYQFHGVDGPLDVNKQSYQPLHKTWMDAGKELGYGIGDPNTLQGEQYSTVDVTTSFGTRKGTWSAFLEPFFKRENAKVYRYAQVRRIILDSEKRATGVEFVRFGKTLKAKARKEVIISAGAFGSPKLLMLSGIGPAAHLKSVGITPKVNLPGVGSNLLDHVHTFLGPFILNDTVSFILDRNMTMDSVLDYAKHGIGPLSWTSISGIGYVATPGVNKAWPNVQAVFFPIGIHQKFAEDTSIFYKIKRSSMEDYVEEYVGKDTCWVLLNVARPKSSGTVRLRSSDPADPPLIDPRYFENPDDMQSMIAGIKIMIKTFEETQAFGQYGAKLADKAWPGCEQYPLRTDDYYECFARHFTGTTWHPSGTCRMGKRTNDPMAVVDSNLRVIGVKNLRVADASVMPVIPNGNLNAPTIMIGEKASAMILGSWEAKTCHEFDLLKLM